MNYVSKSVFILLLIFNTIIALADDSECIISSTVEAGFKKDVSKILSELDKKNIKQKPSACTQDVSENDQENIAEFLRKSADLRKEGSGPGVEKKLIS